MGKQYPTSAARRSNSSRSVVAQVLWVIVAGAVVGVLMSVGYYCFLGAPKAWKEATQEVVSSGGVPGGIWRIGRRKQAKALKTAKNEDQATGGHFGPSARAGNDVLRDGSNRIVGRSDDWPVAGAGDDRPYFDYVLVVFSGDDRDAFAKRENMRELYGTYRGEIPIVDEVGQMFVYTFKVLYVVGHPGAAETGDMMNDVLYVNVQKGYRNIVAKTKKMLEAVKHVRFKYLLKADDDTFVCLRRTASQMHLVPPHIQPKVYGGIPTACHLPNNPDEFVGRVIKDQTNKWYDGKYLNHTMNGLDCYPVYMQGAFYILSYPLVEFLQEGSSKLLTFDNEDVTIGLWLHGVDRAIFPLNDLRDARLWECSCKRSNFVPANDANVFFHHCKSMADMKACKESLPAC